MTRPTAWLAVVAIAAALVAGCGGGLTQAEDDWCGGHLDAVKRAIPEERLSDYEYMDETWKEACRRAFAAR